jgi:Pilin accessory protein (PilO)
MPLTVLPLQNDAVAVVGLLWRPLPLKNSKSTAQQLLKNAGAEHWVLHCRDDQAQCGIAPLLPEGQQYYSAALLLMVQLGDHWVGIFEWQNGQYLLFGVADGQIVPGCDALFESAAAVTTQFERYQALCEWSTCYAPTHLRLGGTPLDLDTLLNSHTPLAYPLRAAYNTARNKQRLLLGGGLLLLILTLAYLGWRYHAQQRAALQLAQQRLLQAQKQRQWNKQQQTEAVWRQQPAAWTVLQQCVRRLSHYPLLLGGWQLTETQCTPQKITATYRRVAPYYSGDFIRAAAVPYPGAYQLKSAEQAEIQQSLRLETRPEEQLQPLPTLFKTMMSPLERGAASGRIDDCLSAAHRHKKSAYFELSGQESPLQLLYSTDLSGVVIQRVNNKIMPNGTLTWSVQGTLYGQ